MRAPNPIASRIDYVSRTYPDRRIPFYALAVWANALGEHVVAQNAAAYYRAEGIWPEPTMDQLLARLRPENRHTEFDAYVPWLAREIRRSEKLMDQNHAAELRHDMFLRFRAVVLWAKATGTDLNRLAYADAAQATHEYHLEEGRLAALEGRARPTSGRVVYRWPDGWTVEELDTRDQLRWEGEAMQHCVGGYQVRAVTRHEQPDLAGIVAPLSAHWAGYKAGDNAVFDGQDLVRIFSLRDPKGRPHATMEWNVERGYVSQLKGKQNQIPLLPYVKRMVAFRRDHLEQAPHQRVRELTGMDAATWDFFAETFEGAWAYNRHGDPFARGLRGPALEQEMERNDELVLVYSVPHLSEAVALDPNDVRRVLDYEWDRYDNRGDGYADDPDPFRRLAVDEDTEFPQGFRDFLGEMALDQMSLEEAHVPAVDWQLWERGYDRPNTVDEMLEAVAEHEFRYHEDVPRGEAELGVAANPANPKDTFDDWIQYRFCRRGHGRLTEAQYRGLLRELNGVEPHDYVSRLEVNGRPLCVVGSGSQRDVYLLDVVSFVPTALKVHRSPAGRQNCAEILCATRSKSPLAPDLYAWGGGKNPRWVEVELLRDIDPAEFKRLTGGVDIGRLANAAQDQLAKFWYQAHERDADKVKYSAAVRRRFKEQLLRGTESKKASEFADQLLRLLEACALAPWELGNLHSWGVNRAGALKASDLGLALRGFDRAAARRVPRME